MKQPYQQPFHYEKWGSHKCYQHLHNIWYTPSSFAHNGKHKIIAYS